MTLEDFLTNKYSFSGSTLVFFGLIASILLIGLTAYIFDLRSKLQVHTQPKYGFLGKSIYQFAAFAVVLGGVAFSIYTITSPGTGISDSSASDELGANFNYKILQKGVNYEMEFEVIPLLDGKAWGGDVKNNFNIFVDFRGALEFTEQIYSATSDTQAVFRKLMPPNDYEVVITVVYRGRSEEFIKQLPLSSL